MAAWRAKQNVCASAGACCRRERLARQDRALSTPLRNLLVCLAIGILSTAVAVYICSEAMRFSLIGRLCLRLELVTNESRAANAIPNAPVPTSRWSPSESCP